MRRQMRREDQRAGDEAKVRQGEDMRKATKRRGDKTGGKIKQEEKRRE